MHLYASSKKGGVVEKFTLNKTPNRKINTHFLESFKSDIEEVNVYILLFPTIGFLRQILKQAHQSYGRNNGNRDTTPPPSNHQFHTVMMLVVGGG